MSNNNINGFAPKVQPGTDANDVPPITAKWAVADIIYTSIIAPIMLAAVLEWVLWMAAFLYCLVKVYIKAEHWTIRFMAVVMIFFFVGFRMIFLPIMVVTLPLPPQVTRYFPEQMVSGLQWFAFWAFAGLLTVPWLFCVYQLVTKDLGRKRRIKHVLDETSAPKVVIVMPCYNEDPDILLKAINSVVDCDYPPSCIHVFVSFDGDSLSELFPEDHGEYRCSSYGSACSSKSRCHLPRCPYHGFKIQARW